MINVYYIIFLKEYICIFIKWGLKVGFVVEFVSFVIFIIWGLVFIMIISCSVCVVIVFVFIYCNI